MNDLRKSLLPEVTPTKISGIPDSKNQVALMLLRSRLDIAVREFADEHKLDRMRLEIVYGADNRAVGATVNVKSTTPESPEDTLAKRASQYTSQQAGWTFSKLALDDEVLRDINGALVKITHYDQIFEQWGLKDIEPNVKSALNFFGPPGTGKTMAAHAIAERLQKKIIIASYADIESKYHGDGPKNVQALFHAAGAQGAVLFIDEADSLLSKRLTNVSQGSEQAINSMRSQLLISMEQHKGLIVFATNLAKNYDSAFDTRLVHVQFKMPNEEMRNKIIAMHLPSRLPRCPGFDIEKIAKIEGVCGRDIKNAILSAATTAVSAKKSEISDADVISALSRMLSTRDNLRDVGVPLSEGEKIAIGDSIRSKLKAENVSVPG